MKFLAVWFRYSCFGLIHWRQQYWWSGKLLWYLHRSWRCLDAAKIKDTCCFYTVTAYVICNLLTAMAAYLTREACPARILWLWGFDGDGRNCNSNSRTSITGEGQFVGTVLVYLFYDYYD